MNHDDLPEYITSHELAESLHRNGGLPYYSPAEIEAKILSAPLLLLLTVARHEPSGVWETKLKFPNEGTFHVTVRWEPNRE